MADKKEKGLKSQKVKIIFFPRGIIVLLFKKDRKQETAYFSDSNGQQKKPHSAHKQTCRCQKTAQNGQVGRC
ncbi:hypothetical protein [Bacillus subtilis]|uniref:hypothetical protein n=1 Tax=Bacillus subtilis TaxID=1423 RepID=UPI003EB892E5